MQIVCPHCTTSYAVKPNTFGPAGRNVRCSRCKEVWLARPEDAADAPAMMPAMAEASQSTAESDAAAEWEALAREGDGGGAPEIDSPSISADWPTGEDAAADDTNWPSVAADDAEGDEDHDSKPRRRSRRFGWPASLRIRSIARPGLPAACGAMAALVLALMFWRTDVVRLLPQTALFYKSVGLDVNLRGLAFKDIKITNDSIDGKPVLVIEGMIVSETRKAVELPRLRFSVRDAQGAEIYAWNAVLEPPVLKPGERAFFKSRLASPPPEGRNIDVRFFNKQDLVGGHA